MKLSTAVMSDVSMVSDDYFMLSQMLCSFSRELSYVLSRHTDEAGVVTDKLCCKLLAWLRPFAQLSYSLLCSDDVS